MLTVGQPLLLRHHEGRKVRITQRPVAGLSRTNGEDAVAQRGRELLACSAHRRHEGLSAGDGAVNVALGDRAQGEVDIDGADLR